MVFITATDGKLLRISFRSKPIFYTRPRIHYFLLPRTNSLLPIISMHTTFVCGFLSARAFMPRTKPSMQPVSVQQMLSKQINVCEEKQLEYPGRNLGDYWCCLAYSRQHTQWGKKNPNVQKISVKTYRAHRGKNDLPSAVTGETSTLGSWSTFLPFLRAKSMAGFKRMN